jgi:hypothetical protein
VLKLTHRARQVAVAAATMATVVVLAGCGAAQQPEFLSENGLDGLTGQEIVERLDASTDARPLPFTASVREDHVILSDDSTEVTVSLPQDVYYVAVGPYLIDTHECYYHSLATCQGELTDEQVHVTITDDDGTVLVDETTTTHANGFVGFWLPRDITGTIEISFEDYTGTVPFSTSDGSPTCITTLQMA